MTPYQIILETHSGIRWLLLLIAVVALIKFLIGWLQKGEFKGMDRGLMAAFIGLVDLNALLGLIMLLWRGIQEGLWNRERLEHAFVMTLVVVVAHGASRWRKSGSDAIQFRNNFIVILITLILIVVGVTTIGGW